MLRKGKWDFLSQTIEHEGALYEIGRWIALYDKDGKFKASSSSEDLLQFYEEGDVIKHQYCPFPDDDIYVDVTEKFLKEFDVEGWKLEGWKLEDE